MIRLIFVVLLMWAGTINADTETDIRSALDYFVENWNEGNLETIRGYYHPDFVLITDQGAIPLAQRIDDMETIAQAGEDRGELEHGQVVIKALGDKHALAYGELKLKFKDGSALNSWFTTAYVNTPFGWKAILTHN
jgi:ketosteroid isomerase-like protein